MTSSVALDRTRCARDVFEAALELEGAARASFLREACGDDRELLAEVRALLDVLARAGTQEVFPPLSPEMLRPFDATSAAELPPGHALARYRVLERIGAGGMGTVFAAYDTALERKVALKCLPAWPGDAAVVERVLAEASAMARLSHPNVVTVHDVGVVDGQPFVAMEYVNGMTLDRWRKERPRSVRQVMTVMAMVARGVAAAHAAGIIHRDIKPSNILVDGARVLVTDFGLSVRAEAAASATPAGTPGYMAPELLRGEPPTRASDVFGFCATLHEMLYLRLPRAALAGTGGRRALRVPMRVQRLIRDGLADDPEARPPSMATIATALLAEPAKVTRRYAVAVLAAALVLAAFWAGRREPEPRDPLDPRPQVVSGPAWVQPATAVPTTMFGVTMRSATGAMPSFQVGSVRFWESSTRWVQLQPRRGAFDWTTLDRLVDAANRARLPAVFTIGGTPGWAAPAGARSVYPDDGRTSPPDQMADWTDFVTAVVQRYGDRIEAYEVWVLGNDPRFYAGPVESLVEMTRIAHGVIKRAAPDAIVVCPGMGRLWTTEGQQIMQQFAELGGYQYCDVANIKLYQRSPTDPPETMLELTRTVDRILHRAGVHPPVWNTGTSYEIPLQGSLDEAMAINHAVRFFLVGLYARISRMYFYNWGGTKIPIVLQAEGGKPTASALAVQQLEGWLRGAHIRSCGQGAAIGLPTSVWQCELTVMGSQVFAAAIRWTDHGTQVSTAPVDVVVHHLDGTRDARAAGAAILVTEQPVFLEYPSDGR